MSVRLTGLAERFRSRRPACRVFVFDRPCRCRGSASAMSARLIWPSSPNFLRASIFASALWLLWSCSVYFLAASSRSPGEHVLASAEEQDAVEQHDGSHRLHKPAHGMSVAPPQGGLACPIFSNPDDAIPVSGWTPERGFSFGFYRSNMVEFGIFLPKLPAGILPFPTARRSGP